MFVNNIAKDCDLISDCYWRGGTHEAQVYKES